MNSEPYFVALHSTSLIPLYLFSSLWNVFGTYEGYKLISTHLEHSLRIATQRFLYRYILPCSSPLRPSTGSKACVCAVDLGVLRQSVCYSLDMLCQNYRFYDSLFTFQILCFQFSNFCSFLSDIQFNLIFSEICKIFKPGHTNWCTKYLNISQYNKTFLFWISWDTFYCLFVFFRLDRLNVLWTKGVG
jgi:hypothetical protein